MRRRDFIVVLAGSAAAWPFVVRAQQTRPAKLGVLLVEKREPFSRVFWEGLREFGYIDGQNMQIEYRSAEGKLDRLPTLAAELVDLKVDIIVASETPAVQAAKRATTEIPIVMAPSGDPVGTGTYRQLVQARRKRHGVVCGDRGACGKKSRIDPGDASWRASRGGACRSGKRLYQVIFGANPCVSQSCRF